MHKKNISRRSFLHQSAVLAGGAPLAVQLPGRFFSSSGFADQLEIYVFSKHLQFLDYEEMAAKAAGIGFAGVDLTVRKGGHVEPAMVRTDLPKAVAALRKHGLAPKMMATDVTNIEEEIHRQVLETAAEQGIQFYRLGSLGFPAEGSIPEALATFRKQFKKLAAWNAKHGLQGSYQNHAGVRVGAVIWEIWEMLKKTDPAGLGCQFDIRHAMVEGGLSWPNNLRLIQPRINTIVLKDFRWEKDGDTWKVLNTPLGEGMVDFKKYFRLLKQHGIKVPVSLHLEYDLGGAEHGDRDLDQNAREGVYAAMKRDLATAQRLWTEA